jgi:hypothetical protein
MTTSPPDPSDQKDGALAEFVALREEIVQLTSSQQSIYIFNLAAAGSIASFALSDADRGLSAFLVPPIGYLLAARYYNASLGVHHIGEYIRTELSPRVPGGLGWEAWVQRRAQDRVGRAAPFYVNLTAFLGPALLAWLVGLFSLITQDLRTDARWGGSVLCGLTLVILLLITRLWARRNRYANLPRPSSG